MKKKLFFSIRVIHILIPFSLVLTACIQAAATATRPAVTETLATVPSNTSPAVLSLTPPPIVNIPTLLPTFSAVTSKTALDNAFIQLANAFPFRITETDDYLAEVVYVTTDYAAADRYHSITTQKLAPGKDETITIGTKTWWKINGVWGPTPSGTLKQNNYWDLIPKAQDVTYTGQESVSGVPCFIFSFTLDMQAPGSYLTGSGQAWVGISDGLPRQFDFTPGANTTGGPTNQLYTYGITVDIQQPVP
jgi:hypothetical protein